jgi:FkbM family methyltransferase
MWEERISVRISAESDPTLAAQDVPYSIAQPGKQAWRRTGVSGLWRMLPEQRAVKRKIRTLLFNAAASLFSPLPSRVKRVLSSSLVRTMTAADRYALASRIAGDVNIARFAVRGAQGIFESLSTDLGVLQSYALEGTWADRTVRLASDRLHGTTGTYIDIGANIGLTLVPIARQGVRCYAFEPELANFESLVRNVTRNSEGKNLTLFQLALSDVAGEAKLSLARDNLGDHRIIATNSYTDTDERLETLVRTETLDGLDLTITDPLVVKIDAQGAEPMIIRGGQRMLSRAELFVMEFSPFHMAKFQATADDVLEFLSGNFTEISVGVGERHDFLPRMSKSAALCYLREYFSENKENPDNYLDIAASKSVVSLPV